MCTLYLLNQIGWWCHNAINYNQLGLDLIFVNGHAESHEVSTSVWSFILKTFVTIPVGYTADTSPCINHAVNKNLNPWLIVRHDLTWYIAQTWQNLRASQTMQTVITYRRVQHKTGLCVSMFLIFYSSIRFHVSFKAFFLPLFSNLCNSVWNTSLTLYRFYLSSCEKHYVRS